MTVQKFADLCLYANIDTRIIENNSNEVLCQDYLDVAAEKYGDCILCAFDITDTLDLYIECGLTQGLYLEDTIDA